MRLAVDVGGYHCAVKALRGGNETAALRYGTLTQKLAGFAGMAGDDYTSEEFAQQYDAAAQEAIDGLDDVVDAFATLCGLAGQSHLNHRRADAEAVYGHPSPDTEGLYFMPGTVDVGSVRVASSLGANDSDLPAFWDEVMDHLEGYGWPNADTARLRDAASTWRSAADDVEGLTTYCDSATSLLETQDSPEIPLATQAMRDLRRAVLDLSSSLRSVGQACDEYAATVEGTARSSKGSSPTSPSRPASPSPLAPSSGSSPSGVARRRVLRCRAGGSSPPRRRSCPPCVRWRRWPRPAPWRG